jgi:DNA-binding response OmpR family regulator
VNTCRRAILIVTEDPDESRLIAQSFRKARLPNPLKFISESDAAIAYLKGDGKLSDRKENQRPLLMLLDLTLPKRSGFEVLAWARKQYWMEDLVILALTGAKGLADVRKARRLGATCCLTKPVDFEKLSPIVKNLNQQASAK